MSGYVVGIICIGVLSCLLTLIKYKTIFKPNILFTLLWVAGAILINNNFAGVLDIDDRTNIHIIIALISFNVSYFLFCKKRTIRLNREELCSMLNIRPLWNKILLINFGMVAVCLPYFFKMVRIMLIDSFYQVRVDAYNYGNVYELICSKIINLPMFAFFNILLIISTLKLALGERNNLKLYLLMIFDVIFFSIITGSRNYIAKPFIYFAIAFAFIHVVSESKIRIKPQIVIFGMVIFVILDRAIKARSLHGLSPIENIVIYLFGGIAYYDKIMFSGVFGAENAIPLYGQGMFGWIVSPFFYIVSLLGLTPDYVAESVIGRVSSQGVYISNMYNFNALTTSLYPMWRDFGEFGIALGMVVFAIFVSHYRNKLFRTFNQKNLLIYFSFLCAVSECTQYYEPMFIRFSIQIVLIMIVWRYMRSQRPEKGD